MTTGIIITVALCGLVWIYVAALLIGRAYNRTLKERTDHEQDRSA
jgi:hypothetical protein